jgi:hypothetical protein
MLHLEGGLALDPVKIEGTKLVAGVMESRNATRILITVTLTFKW